MTYPVVAPASGSYPISTSWAAAGTFANTDQNNTNGVANYAWGGVDFAPVGVRVATTGAETYTIVSGSVTLIAGTTVDGVTTQVNDLILIKDAPASSGAGSANSSQPGNGIYYVTGLSGGTQVARSVTMNANSASQNANVPAGGPAGRVVFVRAGTANANAMWKVTTPSGVAAFTYGTTAMAWTGYALIPILSGLPNSQNQQGGINNANVAVQSQVVVSATAYYITNSGLTMPAAPLTGMVANKTRFEWRIALSKTAAGTGTFQLAIYRGTLGTTGDTQDVLQTLGTQTAVVDDMFVDITLIVTTTGATGAYFWTMTPSNVASAIGTPAGFGITRGTTSALFTGTKSSVALNTASLIFGLGFVATTGTPTITVPIVQAAAYNMN